MTTSFSVFLQCTAGGLSDEMDRRFIVTPDSPMPVGRASKTETKQLMPASDNAWIRNPVISRNHAEFLTADFLGAPGLFIQDLRSSHGTFVNGSNIGNRKFPIATGDKIQFGTEVTRGDESFCPPLYDINVVLLSPTPSADPESNVGTTFSYPVHEDSDESVDMSGDADSDDESHVASDDLPPAYTTKASYPPSSQHEPVSFDLSGHGLNLAYGAESEVKFSVTVSDVFSDNDSSDSESDVESAPAVVSDSDSSSDSDMVINEDGAEGEQEQDAELDFVVQEEEDEVIPETVTLGYQFSESPRYAPNSPSGYTPNPYGSSNFPPLSAYDDGPFMYGSQTYPAAAAKPQIQHSFVRAPFKKSPQAFTNAHDLQAWLNDHPAPPTASVPFPCVASQPAPASTATTLTPRGPAEITSSTHEIIQNGTYTRPSNKNDMSIDNLINPPVQQSSAPTPSPVATPLINAMVKRKAEFDAPAEESPLKFSKSDEARIPVVAVPEPTIDIPAQGDATSTTPSVEPAKISRVIAQPKTRRRRLGYGLGCAALGTVVGMVGTFATLMSLPDNIFQ